MLGVWGRVHGLGGRPLAVDEYFFLSSVDAILEHGVPYLPGGGYYTRGLLLQYLTALPLLVLEDRELALRIPSVLFGLGTAGLAWLYGRRVLGPRLAPLLPALVLVSSWEIEFSRFGRMYAGFQFFTLAYVLALCRALEDASGWRGVLPGLLLAAAVLSHQLAIFLVPLLFLPLLLPGRDERFPGPRSMALHGVGATLLSLVAVLYWRLDLRVEGVAERFPAGYAPSSAGNEVGFPSFPFWSVSGEPVANLVVAGAAIVAGAVLGAALGRRRGRSVGAHAAAGALVASAGVHALTATALCVVVLLGWYRVHARGSRDPVVGSAGLAGVGVAAAWVTFAVVQTFVVGDRAWIGRTGAASFTSGFFDAFFWPNPYPVFIQPWAGELPLLGALILSAVAVQVVTRLRRPPAEQAANPGVLVLYFVLALGVTSPFFQTTRYTFFIYPLGLAALILSIDDAARTVARRWARGGRWDSALVAAAVACLLFAATADFNLRHIVRVGSPDVAFRQGEFARFGGLWYPRRDYETPGRFVEERAGPGEPVVVVESTPTTAYVDRDHAVYLARGSHGFDNVSRRGGTVELWSGRPLLSTPADVCRYVGDARVVWMVRSANPTGLSWLEPPFRPAEVWGERLRGAEVAHRSVDGFVEVVRVDLAGAAGPACPGSG